MIEMVKHTNSLDKIISEGDGTTGRIRVKSIERAAV